MGEELKPSSASKNLSFFSRALADHLAQKWAQHKSFSDPLLTQLREGYVPDSAAERGGIDAFLTGIDSDLAECDEAIAQMSDILQSHRNNLQTARDRANALISPVRKLPPDVLTEVFGAYVGFQPGGDYALRIERHRRPNCRAMELTWISSLWRNVACSRSSLWSSLWINTFSFSFEDGEHPGALELISAYLLRSGNAPLIFFIELSYHGSRAQAILDLLLEQSNRWLKVVIATDDRWGSWQDHAKGRLSLDPLRVVPSGEGSFPMLEDLKVTNSGPASSSIEVFSACSGLKKLWVSQLGWPNLALHDWSNLMELHIGELVGDCLGRVLARMPRLKSLAVISFVFKASNDGHAFTGSDGYYHSLLTSLETTYSVCHSPHAWRALRLPHLTTLKVTQLSSYDQDANLAEFPSFLLQSGCMLQNVTVDYLPAQQMVDFLAGHSSSIVALQFSLFPTKVINGSYHSLFLRLTAGNPLSIAPNLRALTVSINRAYAHNIEASVSALEGCSDDICCLVESRCAVSSSFAGSSELGSFTLQIEDCHWECLHPLDRSIRARLGPLRLLTPANRPG